MNSEIDLTKFGFRVGERVELADDDWSVGGEVILVDIEPVPGSTQCVVRAGGETRTVGRGELRHVPDASAGAI